MTICAHNECTGCYACAAICPRHAVTMEEDNYGELHPIINEEKCIGCNMCVKVCPSNNDLSYNYPIKCYAAWITDADKRRICASGGIGTIMSEYVITQQGGVVFGSRYDESFMPIMAYTDRIEDLEKYKGSRYVQSIVGYDTFKKVRTYLNDGRNVLFIGTPCQIAGLKGYLQKDYNSLVTVDLICHGCCPTKYFTEEIAHLSKIHSINNIFDIRFRGNDRNNYALSIWTKTEKRIKRIYKKPALEQPYFASFLLGVALRENCYSCRFSRPDRISDITIGDFIGLGNEVEFPYSRYNVSSVSINTIKGELFYQKLKSVLPELISIERDYTERLKYKLSLGESAKCHQTRNSFREEYLKTNYVTAIRKVLKPILQRNKIKRLLNLWTYLFKIPRKLFKVIFAKFLR